MSGTGKGTRRRAAAGRRPGHEAATSRTQSARRKDPADLVRVLSQVVLMRWADRKGVELKPEDLDGLMALELDKEATEATSADTPSTILAAAMQLFLERGYEVSLDDIAEAARTTKPTIYFYFKDKKELFRAAMQAAADETPPALPLPEDTMDLRSGLLEYARAFRNLILSERNILTYRAALLHLRHAPDLGLARVRKSMQSTNTSLTEFFRQAMREGKIRKMDPELLSEMFFASAAGQARTRRMMGIKSDPPGREERYLAQVIDSFLGGIAVQRGRREEQTRR
jgi:TetR/AcrR family transcriptional regulator, mexJK operon transcriptional repressor